MIGETCYGCGRAKPEDAKGWRLNELAGRWWCPFCLELMAGSPSPKAIVVHAEWREVRRSPIGGASRSLVQTVEQGELVGAALRDPDVRLLDPLLGSVPFFCADPIFAGLPGYETQGEQSADGRSYRTTAHVHWDRASWRRPRFETSVVLPERPDGSDGHGGWNSQTVIHELGHVLEHRLAERGISVPDWTADSNEYGATNSTEAFAIAFSSWVNRHAPRLLAAHGSWFHPDPPRGQLRFFDALAARL